MTPAERIIADLEASLRYLGPRQPWGVAWEWVDLELMELRRGRR